MKRDENANLQRKTDIISNVLRYITPFLINYIASYSHKYFINLLQKT